MGGQDTFYDYHTISGKIRTFLRFKITHLELRSMILCLGILVLVFNPLPPPPFSAFENRGGFGALL